MENIEQRIMQVCNDREHGSRWLVREAVLILRDVAQSPQASQDALMQLLFHYARRIAQSRPAMAALASAVSRVVCAQGGLEAIVQEAQQLLAEYDTAIEHIAVHAQPLLHGHVMTCSISSTVLGVLVANHQQIEQVIVLEGRPRYEGREMARALDTVSISKGEVPAANPRREHGKHPTRTVRSIGHAVAEPANKERLRPLGGCQRKEPDEICVAVDD
jgi:ribose 1,5-bisphosphate isomerase